MPESNGWLAELEQLEQGVKQARKAGDIDAMIGVARDALRQIDTRLADPNLTADDKIRALQAAKRIGYNVAADIYPGWELNTPPRSEAQLAAAAEFAGKSAEAVAQLGLGAAPRGNATWLLGALDLARGDAAGAVTAFQNAAGTFDKASELQLMALGYAAIASHSRADFKTAMAGLENLGSEDAAFFREQLIIASQIFSL